MIIKQIIIALFVTSLLGSNLLWAGEGMFDNTHNNDTHAVSDFDNDVSHHVVDEHHDGHACHMSAHLVGLRTDLAMISGPAPTQFISSYNIHFCSLDFPPPNKPPKA